MTSGVPAISVVIPTFNRRERLARVLASLATQDLDDTYEVVVVSDGSTDGTDEYLRSGAVPLPLVASSQANQGPAAARNRGLELARGDLVVFIDDDVVADPSLLRAHRDAHQGHGLSAVVIGPMLTPSDHAMSPWVRWEQRMLEKQYDAMNAGVFSATCRQFYTGNASVRAEHVRRVGGFDPTFTRAEDVELAFRLDAAGLTFHFEPGAVGYHYAERSLTAWSGAAKLYGRNDVVFARDLGQAWILPFIADGFRRHHVLIRVVVRASLRLPRSTERLTGMARALIARFPAAVSGRLGQHALSALYAVAYHRAVADELGSADAFRALVAGSAPARPTAAAGALPDSLSDMTTP